MDKIQLLENFICDEQLKELEQKFEGFNIFDCLRLTRAEIRHSNFLAWLLDPNETHGMNDYFLKEFLKEVLLKKKNEIKKINGIEIELKIPESENKTRKDTYNMPSIFDIDYWDMSNVDVYREYEYIDLLFVDNTNKFVFVIENKIDTAQHDEQLARYREIVDSKYPNDTYKKLYIYLKPQQEDVEKPYIFVDYSIVKAVLEETKKSKADKISKEILMTIEHYNKIIERDIMDKDNIGKICAQIYRKHKIAIDLINKHSNPQKELSAILEEVLAEKESIQELYRENQNVLLCLPSDISNLDKLKTNKNKSLKNYMVCLKFDGFRGGHEILWAEILFTPVDKEFEDKKSQLLQKLKNNNVEFENDKSNWHWSLPVKIISLEEYCDFKTREDIKAHLSKEIDNLDLIEKLRNAINSAIDENLI